MSYLLRLFCVFSVLVLSACGGARLGVLEDAVVTVAPLDSPSDVLYQTKTSNRDALAQALGDEAFSNMDERTQLDWSGLIDLRNVQFEDEALYLLTVEGGTDVDQNNDGQLDENGDDNRGVFHAIMRGSDLKRPFYNVSALTEACYQMVAESRVDRTDVAAVLDLLHSCAGELLESDITADDDVDYDDIVMWHPVTHKAQLIEDKQPALDELVTAIRSNDNIREKGLALVDAAPAPVSLNAPDAEGMEGMEEEYPEYDGYNYVYYEEGDEDYPYGDMMMEEAMPSPTPTPSPSPSPSPTPVASPVAPPAPVLSGAQIYQQQCSNCHGSQGNNGFAPSLVGCSTCSNTAALASVISATMPVADPGSCVGACANSVAGHIVTAFNAPSTPPNSNDPNGNLLNIAPPAPPSPAPVVPSPAPVVPSPAPAPSPSPSPVVVATPSPAPSVSPSPTPPAEEATPTPSPTPTAEDDVGQAEPTPEEEQSTPDTMTPSSPVDSENLVLYWSFDKPSYFSLQDDSANARLTPLSQSLFSTDAASGYSLLPYRNEIQADFADAAMNNFSVSLWLKPDADDGHNVRLGVGWDEFWLQGNSDRSFYVGIDYGNHRMRTEAETLVPEMWQHVVYTYSETGDAMLYFNGQLINSQQGVKLPLPWDNFRIDRVYGLIDELRVYSRVLTSEEVNSLYVTPGVAGGRTAEQ